MNIEFVGLREINGPLIVLDGVKGAGYDELVKIKTASGSRLGKIIRIDGERVVVQVFEGTEGLSLHNTHTMLTGKPMEIALSKSMLGRIFDGIGRPIDGYHDIYPEKKMDINGLAINPVSREYPHDYISTGISSIDALVTLI